MTRPELVSRVKCRLARLGRSATATESNDSDTESFSRISASEEDKENDGGAHEAPPDPDDPSAPLETGCGKEVIEFIRSVEWNNVEIKSLNLGTDDNDVKDSIYLLRSEKTQMSTEAILYCLLYRENTHLYCNVHYI